MKYLFFIIILLTAFPVLIATYTDKTNTLAGIWLMGWAIITIWNFYDEGAFRDFRKWLQIRLGL